MYLESSKVNLHFMPTLKRTTPRSAV